MKLYTTRIGVLAGLALAAVEAQAFTIQVKVFNAPALADDIHLVFSGTGGTITNPVGVNPAIQNFAGTGGNALNAAWAPPFVGGETYIAQFDVSFVPVSFASGFWTHHGMPLLPITANDVKLEIVPEPATLLSSALGIGLLAARRRRKTQA